jgi:23S rRNA (cytidine1920-2'-O)/16S rRNA (cytidine1409-2'-O)-methyltransferase
VGKNGDDIPTVAEVRLLDDAEAKYLSRGGLKLEGALRAVGLDVAGKRCLDVGQSTGGFTDCLLQHGAVRVYGIDVGYGQTAWSLRTDDRVVLRERTNLRHLSPADLYGPEDPLPDLAVADVSFISLALVLPALLGLLQSEVPVDLVLLVKPQFEVGKSRVGKGGVVRDPDAHCDAIAGVIAAAGALGLEACGLVASPITGPAGNHEYLLWLRRLGVVQHDVAQTAELEQANPEQATPAPPATATVGPAQIKALVASTLTARARGDG